MKREAFLFLPVLSIGFLLLVLYGCKEDDSQYNQPSITTFDITQVTLTSASAICEITDDGGSDVTERGVVWGLNPNPGLQDHKTSDGTGSGSFQTILSGLEPFTKYYFRPYATNIAGTSFGPEKEFSTARSAHLIIGDTTDMIIRQYNQSVVAGGRTEALYYFDVDNDAPYDIGFLSENWGSNAFGYPLKHSKIYSLENRVQFHGYYTTDTCFVKIDSDTINEIVYITTTFSFLRMSNNDSICKIIPDLFKLTPLDKGDTIMGSGIFKTIDITLNDSEYKYTNTFAGMPVSPRYTNVYKNNMYQFPQDEEKYIGFSFNESRRLGWIKVLITNRNEILVIESGVQR